MWPQTHTPRTDLSQNPDESRSKGNCETSVQYLWDAAADLHPTGPGRAAFVARTARDLLGGHPGRVILDLTGHHDILTQTGAAAPGLKRCIDYLTAKQPYLIYRIALTMGWPIATGVIEGACRYLIIL